MTTDDQNIIEFAKELKGKLNSGEFDTVMKEYIRVTKRDNSVPQEVNNKKKKNRRINDKFVAGVILIVISTAIFYSISYKSADYGAMVIAGVISAVFAMFLIFENDELVKS